MDVSKASNVLDRWINAASRSLTSFVSEEMNGYRLYSVVPVLLKFINNLTNIYVRYNRRRLKGSKGSEDTMMALVSLYDVLLTVCKVSVKISVLNLEPVSGGLTAWDGSQPPFAPTHDLPLPLPLLLSLPL